MTATGARAFLGASYAPVRPQLHARAHASLSLRCRRLRYMDKRLLIKLNANRSVAGVLRGFDQFMNLVLDETVEQVSTDEQNPIGMVVIRGNSIVMIEALEKLWDLPAPARS